VTPRVTVVIPAFREAGRVGETVRSAASVLAERIGQGYEILVIDDGSRDETATEAECAGARVLRLDRNQGKGAALRTGLTRARGEVLILLDADLMETSRDLVHLLEPILADQADMTVAVFPPVEGKAGGFGLVKRLARWGLRRAGGQAMQAPLSGQRAMSRQTWERIGRLDPGFGIEMGLNLDALRLGLRVLEVRTRMAHRATGRDWAGFLHRGRQFRDVALAILRRWPLRRLNHGDTETRSGARRGKKR
jgi:glycosyltransferase involved in cell wall biosynthesis